MIAPTREFAQLKLLYLLMVTNLDRLGRNATVEAPAGFGVGVHWLALGGVDPTSGSDLSSSMRSHGAVPGIASAQDSMPEAWALESRECPPLQLGLLWPYAETAGP